MVYNIGGILMVYMVVIVYMVHLIVVHFRFIGLV